MTVRRECEYYTKLSGILCRSHSGPYCYSLTATRYGGDFRKVERSLSSCERPFRVYFQGWRITTERRAQNERSTPNLESSGNWRYRK